MLTAAHQPPTFRATCRATHQPQPPQTCNADTVVRPNSPASYQSAWGDRHPRASQGPQSLLVVVLVRGLGCAAAGGPADRRFRGRRRRGLSRAGALVVVETARLGGSGATLSAEDRGTRCWRSVGACRSAPSSSSPTWWRCCCRGYVGWPAGVPVGLTCSLRFRLSAASPDVVVVQFSAVAHSARRGAVVEHSDLASWCAMTDRAGAGLMMASARDLAAHVGISPGHLARVVLPRLRERGVVAQAGRGRWELAEPHESPVSRLVTVELKTRDRFGALHQAVAHGQGVDRAWVVLDAARVRPEGAARAAVREAYASRGIGLGTLARGRGTVKVLIPPARGGASSFSEYTGRVARAVLAERVFALHLAGTDTGPTWPVFVRSLAPSGHSAAPGQPARMTIEQ